MKYSFLPKNSQVLIAAATLLFAAFSSFGQWSQNASPLPSPTGFVSDHAGVIDEGTKQRLEAKLKNFRDKTNPSVEIAVVTVRTTGERAIFDYSLAVARGWRIGSKEDDNPSALLLVAVDDRKYFTQVSKDLEDELPDGVVGSLQRQYLVPEFRKGNYAKGIEDTVNAYLTTIENKGNAPINTPQKPTAGPASGVGGGTFGFFCCAFILIIILIAIFSRSGRGRSSRDRDRWGGGGFGGGRGTDAGDVAAAALPWVIGSILSSGGGSSDSSSSDWGGSSDSGGWGGFGGGGDFGGGGAGGGW